MSAAPRPLAGFGHGGTQAGAPPSAALAAALEAAAGPGGLYDGADTDELVGIVRQWAAVESWAAAGKLAALRAMMREDGEGAPLLRRRGDLPDGWDDSLNYEVAGALAMGPVSAGNLAGLAWALGARLPGIGRLLADGTLTLAKAKLVAAVFEPLDEGEAARAEALIMAELAGKTYFQVERLAWRAALAVAPDVAERRRSQAERERARVTVFREESGAVGLSALKNRDDERWPGTAGWLPPRPASHPAISQPEPRNQSCRSQRQQRGDAFPARTGRSRRPRPRTAGLHFHAHPKPQQDGNHDAGQDHGDDHVNPCTRNARAAARARVDGLPGPAFLNEITPTIPLIT